MKLKMNKEMKVSSDYEQRKAVILLVCTAVLWSTSGILIKLVDWNPVAIAGIRSAVAALLMWAYVKRPHFTWSAAQIGGAVAYAATVILFVVANKMTTSANVILLQYTAPIYVAIFGHLLLGEKTTRMDLVAIIMVFLGMGLFFKDELSPGAFWGNILAVLSGVTFALVAVLLRMQKQGSPIESVILGNILAAIIAIPFMTGPYPDIKGWVVLVFMGLFQLGLSYILYSNALIHVTAMEGILIPLIEPVLNPIWVLIFTGEKPGIWALVGGVLVLIAVTTRSIIMVYKKS
jgi:drug/metabolite transporter (DMT)-like permease